MKPGGKDNPTATQNEPQERSNSPTALQQALEQVSAVCGAGAGLPKKPLPGGKPQDMLTSARQAGR